MAVRKGGLGKGLDALFIDNTTDNGPVTLRISEIEPNRSQPRKEFDEAALADLADSIREHGVIQPLLVRPLPSGGYQLVAGERRWRASQGHRKIPSSHCQQPAAAGIAATGSRMDSRRQIVCRPRPGTVGTGG